MSESEERIAEIATLEKLGPEVESLFTSGREPEPLMRGTEVDRVVRLLKAGANVALIGPQGIGKRSLALSLRRSREWETGGSQQSLSFAQKLVHPDSWPVYCTTTMNWVSGSFYVGNLENRMFLLVKNAGRSLGRSVILFDRIHTAIGAWQAHNDRFDLIDLLMPLISHPKVSMVATATPEGWAQITEQHADFAGAFVAVQPPPPTAAECRTIIDRELSRMGVDPARSTAATRELFTLVGRHFAREHELAAALRILGSLRQTVSSGDALPATRLVKQRSPLTLAPLPPELPACTVAQVRDACAQSLRIRRCWVGADRTPPRSAILAQLEQTVFGQGDACEALADDLLVFAQGLADPGRPRSYLFVGTAGIGKTSLAVAVQRLLNDEVAPLRFDCTEYSSPLDVARLIGREPGSLTVGLIDAPARVVVFDEIDKAHPSVKDVLYQLTEGRITSLDGTVVSTGNAIVALTTNAGSEAWLSGREVEAEDQAARLSRAACLRMLGPALASRIDRVVVFPPLSLETAVSIAAAEMERFSASPSLLQRAVSVAASPGLVEGMARAGLSKTNGARGIKKVVQAAVAVPVARYLSEQKVHHCHLQLEPIWDDDGLAGVRIEREAVL